MNQLEVSLQFTITGSDKERALKLARIQQAIEKLENDADLENPEYEFA